MKNKLIALILAVLILVAVAIWLIFAENWFTNNNVSNTETPGDTLYSRAREMALARSLEEFQLDWVDLSVGVETTPWDVYDTIIVNGNVIDGNSIWLDVLFGYRSESGTLIERMRRPILFVPLIEIAEKLGYIAVWDDDHQRVTLTLDGEDYKFWIGVRGVYIKGQSELLRLGASPVKIDDTIFVPADFFPAHVFEKQLYIGEGYKSRVADIEITSFDTIDEHLDFYHDYIEFVDPVRESACNILIVPAEPLRDFMWIELEHNDGIYIKSNLFAAENIMPDRPFVVNWGRLGSMPHRGISFLDDSGERRYFMIIDNMASFEENPGGNIMFTEFIPVNPF